MEQNKTKQKQNGTKHETKLQRRTTTQEDGQQLIGCLHRLAKI